MTSSANTTNFLPGALCALLAAFLVSAAPASAQKTDPGAPDTVAADQAPAEEIAAGPSRPRGENQVTVDSIAAVVNKDVITVRELQKRIAMAKKNFKARGGQMPPDDVFQSQMLEMMIVESAQMQMANEVGLTVKDAQLDHTISQIARSQGLTLEQFKHKIEQQGAFSDFREQMRRDITQQRLRDREVVRKIQVNDAEVDHLLGSQAKAVKPEEIRLGHIFIGVEQNASPADVEIAKKKIDNIYKLLKDGTDFQQAAASHSEAKEGESGGDIGWRPLDRMPQLFIDALTGVPKGGITPVIKSPSGFHILKVIDRRMPESAKKNYVPMAGDTVQQTHARHILIKVNQLVTAVDAKRKLLDIKRRVENGTDKFEELAKTFSVDTSSVRGGDLGWLYPGDTVPEFEKAMNELQPGQISEPVETQFGFHLIQVLERKQDDVSEARRRSAAKQSLREKKIAEATEEWLRQVRDRAYVEYRLGKPNE